MKERSDEDCGGSDTLSELVANEALPDIGTDPRAGAVSLAPLESEKHEVQNLRGLLIHHTRASHLRIGAAMDHLVEGPEGMTMEAESTPDIARVSPSGCRRSSALASLDPPAGQGAGPPTRTARRRLSLSAPSAYTPKQNWGADRIIQGKSCPRFVSRHLSGVLSGDNQTRDHAELRTSPTS